MTQMAGEIGDPSHLGIEELTRRRPRKLQHSAGIFKQLLNYYHGLIFVLLKQVKKGFM